MAVTVKHICGLSMQHPQGMWSSVYFATDTFSFALGGRLSSTMLSIAAFHKLSTMATFRLLKDALGT